MSPDIKKILAEKKPSIDKIIEKWIPRAYDEKTLARTAGTGNYDIDAVNKVITEPIWDLLDRGGKRWRPTLMLLIIEALGKDPEEYVDFAAIPELIHNGTLMIDDIEDDSELRRGKPCTHKKFGIDISINAGNMLYYLPMQIVLKSKLEPEKKSKIYDTYIQEMINISFGQGFDIAWHRGLGKADDITEAQYLQMCAFKTGTLARMAAKLGAILADADDKTIEKIGRFAETIGVAFQIQDDILNIQPTKEWGKEIGDDINEGKRTLMVIHTLKKASDEDKKRLIQILNMHTKDPELIKEAIDIMKKYGSIKYAKEYARKMVSDAWKDVEKILPESDAKKILKSFAEFLIEREI